MAEPPATLATKPPRGLGLSPNHRGPSAPLLGAALCTALYLKSFHFYEFFKSIRDVKVFVFVKITDVP